jgi:hypothetical protein
MIISPIKPRKALNKAFLKAKPTRSEIERFKSNLAGLLDKSNDTETEEFHKNLVSDFLKNTYYTPNHFINTKGRNDLVIHNGSKADSTVGVIIEAKKPTNKSEMPTLEKLNSKAFHELVLYYLHERIALKNLEIKHLVITNIYEWFIFDVSVFERLFAQSKAFVKQFEDFEAGRLADSKTDFFYRHVAGPFIQDISQEVEFTHFNLQDYQKPLRNKDKADDNKLIALYKLLSPEHLLKLPFANDSNSLDKRFYSELLHIIGLTETKQGGKKLIERNPEGKRNEGSLLENTIVQLDSMDLINNFDKPSLYGATRQERIFNVAMELCITWMNRILFLKLLEAQLLSYHKKDKAYEFLSMARIPNYDVLNKLFFQVLAKKYDERSESVTRDFGSVPFLNSSLFETSEVEQKTIRISGLEPDLKIPVLASTVLKNKHGKRMTGTLDPLEYLFSFLNAYDFSSEGSEEIQEENKSLINASVLGLIFEKINGYKDGSFFTPGFITMYMCRETIRKSVLQKFNETKEWNCQNLDELYNKIEDRQEANTIINSIKICDPAVGSGHFLVSALNEIIAIKGDLKILQDRQGRRLKEYVIEVVNDELAITDEDGQLFSYKPGSAESQRLQETLFNEKQTIIENCLFGVDINPNSVKICRLRLWIELLKSAYYVIPAVGTGHALSLQQPPSLETLPNIDINIKCGNSLVSRFALDADLRQALKKSRWTIDSYKAAVDTYRNAENKEQKREMERLIADIKSDFRSDISQNDPKIKRLKKLEGEVYQMTSQPQLFEMSAKEKATWNKRLQKLTAEAKSLETDIEAIKANKIFENAFEWRFEFPEVLNDDGDFVGFDVILGNPPYIRQEEFSAIKPYLQSQFSSTFAGTADLYVYFVELSMKLLRSEGDFTFIIPNKWMRAGYGKSLRGFVQKFSIEQMLDFGDLPVFEEATTYPSIIHLSKGKPKEQFSAANIQTLDFPSGMPVYINKNKITILTAELQPEGWTLTDSKVQKLLAKIRSKGIPLGEYVNGKIFRGVLTGLNEAFVIDQDTRDRLVEEDPKSAEIIKPFLAGRDIKRYQQPVSDKYLIFTRRGINIENYPAILKHLEQFRTQLEPKPKNHSGSWPGRKQGTYKWYEIQDAVDYYEEFEKEKILWPGITSVINAFALDSKNYYGNDNNQLIITSDKALLGILNSKLVKLYLMNTADYVRGGFIRLKISYVSSIPIPVSQNHIKEKISDIVSELLINEKRNFEPDTIQLEDEIDRLVYELYGLTEEEIGIVEGAT